MCENEPMITESDQEIIMDVRDIKKYYPVARGSFSKGKKKTLKALDGVSLKIKKGEIFGIVGESGCGKSTLGRAMLRLFDITDGQVIFQGQDITQFSRRQMKNYRRDMQMIFQNPYSSFNPKLKIGTSLREVGQVYGMSQEKTGEKIRELLDYIHLPEDMLVRSPGELSGGQLQRLAIARALILDPSFIVADEPVSALDVSVQAQILNLITDLRKKMGMTMLFISHEMTVVEHICDQVAVMYLGKVMEVAPTKVLFKNLLHPYTQALMSAIPKADPEANTQRIMLEGDIPNAIDLPLGCRFASRCRFCTEECKKVSPQLTDVGDGHFVACHRYKEGGKS